MRLLVEIVDISDEVQDICYTMFKGGGGGGKGGVLQLYARITDIKK